MTLALAACGANTTTQVGQDPQPVQVQPEVKQPERPNYAPVPEQKFGWEYIDGGQSQLDFNPAVDILFIIDNSDSMKSEEANLSKNLTRFTSGIFKNKMIDYHIGVTSTWDSSERFYKTKTNSYNNGDLWYVKDSSGKVYNKRFVTKNEKNLLDSTLNIGVAPYEKGGPEKEEFFSPLVSALEKSGHGDVNDEFFRKDAQLVVIFMTDADDSSANLTPEETAQKLFDFKDGKKEKVSVYGVLTNKKNPDEFKDWDLRIHPKYHPECFDMTLKVPKNNGKCTIGFGPDRMEQFIVLANPLSGTPDEIRQNHIMNVISKTFGDDLSKIGSDIVAKTLAKEIFLPELPRLSAAGHPMIVVYYGTPDELAKGQGQQILEKSAKNKTGWVFDSENVAVKLPGDINYQYKEGARFKVGFSPVTVAN
jgi:hypothetical protein